ncbi:MAG: hypothetical protein FWF25_01470 [Propionibacteriaceae bacterium]|nr:hypothetical protein [Propionibacteriaceae bacterium]
MATVSKQNPQTPKTLSVIVGIVGVLMLLGGIGLYIGVSVQLTSQHATVSVKDPDDPGPYANQEIRGPITAYAQIQVIQHHLNAITGGKTFGQLPLIATSDGKTYNADVTEATTTDGQVHKKGDPLSSADAKTYSARNTAQTASFLEASLLVSIMAFGVAVMIAGLGLLFIVISFTLLVVIRMATRRE